MGEQVQRGDTSLGGDTTNSKEVSRGTRWKAGKASANLCSLPRGQEMSLIRDGSQEGKGFLLFFFLFSFFFFKNIFCY